MSLAMIAFVGVAVAGATGAFFSDSETAFFSDTETSTGNTFTAGDIDLQIDNESYAIDYVIPGYENPIGVLALSSTTSWSLRDLTVEKFFNFTDVKPGDYGEDTISLHVGSNDAWLCASAEITSDLDNSITEPEDEESGANNDGNDGTPDGDLDSALRFAFWEDDGDNVLETDETENIFLNGTLSSMGEAGGIALADNNGGILGEGNPIPGGSTFYIAKAWCYGTLTTSSALTQDGLGKVGTPQNPNNIPNGPLIRGTGILCDGSAEGNIGQTDSVVGDLTFEAVQARNNSTFLCNPQEGPTTGTLTVTKIVNNDSGGEAEVINFPLFLDSVSITSGVATTTSSGPHTVSETGLFGYEATFGGDCAANGTVNVPAGGSASCTVTNDDIQPTISLVKNVVGGTASPDDFDLSINGNIVTSGSSNPVSANAAHEIDEEAEVPGYGFTSITGESFLGVDCPAVLQGTVTLAPGDTITCTITNTLLPI